MTQRHLTSAFLRSARVRALTQAGAALTMLALWGCGGTGTTNGDDAGAGGSATGGGGTGGDSSGGAASGGAATGGSGAGGAGAGGTASGGAQGETVPACPGFPAASESTGCRSQADCLGASCQATQPSGTICGACFASPMECGTDAACGEGAVCVTGPDMPCQCNGRGTVCAAACTSDSCEDGFVCGDDGHCALASCEDDGYACQADTVCDPTRTGDGHGCAPAACDTDGFTCSSDTVCDPSRAGDGHGCAARSCQVEGYECQEGTVCDPVEGADAHGCRVIHCTEGTECAENHDCNPNATGNGCVRRSCSGDTDCDCGACVLGHCEERLFICVTLPS